MKVDKNKTQNYILVNAIIYFNCIIANTIIAMVYYNYQISLPHSSSTTTDYYTTTTTNTATYYYPLNWPHFSSLHMTYIPAA